MEMSESLVVSSDVEEIITEISKEVENNTISRVNAYARQYVSRRNVAAGGSNAGGGSSGRS